MLVKKVFERQPRQSSAAGLIVTTDDGQKQTRETFTTGLSYQDRRPSLAPAQIRAETSETQTRAAAVLLLSIQQTHVTDIYPLRDITRLRGRR